METEFEAYQCDECHGVIQTRWANGKVIWADAVVLHEGVGLFHTQCWEASPRSGTFVHDPWFQ